MKLLQRQLSPVTSLIIVISFGAVVNFLVYQFQPDLAGPITASSLMLVSSILLYNDGLRWSDLGLRKMRKPYRLIWQVPTTFILTLAAALIGNFLFSSVFGEVVPYQTRFEGMEGNVMMFIKWVVIGWIVGGFFEELIFRGFLLHYFEKVFESNKYATLIAVLAQGFIFGLVHFYNRGIVGALSIFIVSLVLGSLYLKFKRNLWPLILAHGIMDTLSFLEEFLGA